MLGLQGASGIWCSAITTGSWDPSLALDRQYLGSDRNEFRVWTSSYCWQFLSARTSIHYPSYFRFSDDVTASSNLNPIPPKRAHESQSVRLPRNGGPRICRGSHGLSPSTFDISKFRKEDMPRAPGDWHHIRYSDEV